jgi:23S rRNA (cytosine1962-C5)-methyltransferase
MVAASPDSLAYPDVRVNGRAAARYHDGHPWIYASDVTHRGTAQPGDVVRVLDPKGRSIGIAHYSSTSQICLRRLSSKPEPVDRGFFLGRLHSAERHRRRVVRDSDSYRLVHAEADLLPSLIIDRYNDCLVMQTLNQGMNRNAELLADCLEELFAPRAIVARNDPATRDRESLPREVKLLRGAVDAPVELHLNGLTMHADLLAGQKTGVYLDQRENYAAAARWGRGRALDCFTSTGGFALHLARTCDHVDAIDSSGPALATARANAERNNLSNIEWREADVFDYLSGLAPQQRYDLIVLDPPAFAKTKAQVDTALRAYKEINLRALRMLDRGGVLVTCSCSHHVSEADLFGTVASAALDAKRNLRVLERRAQAADHPVLLTVPETLYLKCLILEVVEG